MHERTLRLSFHAILLATVGACNQADVTAPPPPRVDPVVSPTSIAVQSITGSAEYGATVRITGGLQDVEVTADDFTALWRADVELVTDIPSGAQTATTTLSITAIDADDNVSEPTEVVILYEPPHPEALVLELSKDLITADEGEVTATVRTQNDELLDLSGFDILFTLTGVPGVTAPNDTQTVTTNSSGVARATFTNLRGITDAATISVTSFSLQDERTFRVIAGRAAAFSLFELTGTAADGAIEAGEDVTYDYATEDAYSNPTEGQVLVSVNSPNAVVFDDGLSGSGAILGLTQVGAYSISARIAGSGAIQSLPLTVGIASGNRYVDLALTLDRMAVGDTVFALTIVRDAYGNIIDTPSPAFTIAPQDPAMTDFALQAGNAFTVTKPGVYKITATFDDGTNPSASDEEYLLVEAIPDLQPPTVRILSIDGFVPCPDGTLEVLVPNDCTDTDPAITFTRRQWVTVTVEVDDDRGLAEVGFKAFGFGLSADDFTFIGTGAHTPGTPLSLQFIFRVNDVVMPGDAKVVAQAKDSAGNAANSIPVLMRLDLGIDAVGERTVEAVAGGGTVPFASDVTYSESDGALYTSNRDTNGNDTTVTRVLGGSVGTYALFPDPPEWIVADDVGNLFVTLDNADEVWLLEPDGTQTPYVALGNPEGLALIASGRPATGRFLVAGDLQDEDCVSLDGQVYELDASNDGCAGAVGGCGTAQDVCVTTDGSQADVLTQLTAAITINNTAATAYQGADCDNLFGNGDPCVFLVATTPGNLGGPLVLNVLQDSNGNLNATDIDDGENASLLYVADRGNGNIREYQAPFAPQAASLNTFDLNNNPRGVAAGLRGDPLNPRLLLYVTDDNNDDIREWDTGTASVRTIANQGDGLDGPWGITFGDTDCLLVSNENSGEIMAVDIATGTTQLVATGFNSPRGMTREGSGVNAPLIVADRDYQLLIRISATPDATDCF